MTEFILYVTFVSATWYLARVLGYLQRNPNHRADSVARAMRQARRDYYARLRLIHTWSK